MTFEGLICPKCSTPLEEVKLQEKLACTKCGVNLKDKRFIAFLEFLMMQGIVTNLDFFDPVIYGDEINIKSEEEKELMDETDPEEYEDKVEKIEYYEDNVDLKEKTTDEEEFRAWEGLDEDWLEFNRRDSKNTKPEQ